MTSIKVEIYGCDVFVALRDIQYLKLSRFFHTGKTEFHYQGNEITRVVVQNQMHMIAQGTHA
jgi:hypothetical protein